jgi:Family of unknown function (DUF6665)
MTVRPPRMNSSKTRENVLDYEIVQEQAAALGRLGRALEAALAALSKHDELRQAELRHGELRHGELRHGEFGGDHGSKPAAGTVREHLLREAGTALWCFVVQREACGLRDQKTIMREYRVPREVQNRMGTFGR